MTRELFKSERRQTMEALRELFQTLGRSVSMSVLWDEALERNLIPVSVINYYARRGGMELCRDAVKERGTNGLPFAQPVGEGVDAEWQQLMLFTRDQAVDLLNKGCRALEADREALRRLYDFFCDRFKDMPEFPLLTQTEWVS